MYATVNGLVVNGIRGQVIQVEIDLTNSLPGFDIVGLPTGAVREARERVRAAIKNSGYIFTKKRITVNLAPADVKKEGTSLDLAMAIGLLLLEGALDPKRIGNTAFVGELSLNGEINPVNGVLPMAIAAEEQGMKRIFVPEGNFAEAVHVSGLEVVGVGNLRAFFRYIESEEGERQGFRGTSNEGIRVKSTTENMDGGDPVQWNMDMNEIQGHSGAKRALEIAAAGNHNILLAGPPGAGKTMLAKRLVTILPEMTYEERIEVTKIYSVAGLLKNKGLVTARPIRAPHHSISAVAMSGGGGTPKPGEVTLAHGGVLFLDEMPEFGRNILEVLRQPMEDEQILISRLNGTVCFPADFLLVGSMNYCECGFYKDGTDRCHCTEYQIRRYGGKISGPLLDRIDMKLEVPSIRFSEFEASTSGDSSAVIRARVERAVATQRERFFGLNISRNSQMGTKHLKQLCPLSPDLYETMEKASKRLHLSTRGVLKAIRIARTIADLTGEKEIKRDHLMEAIGYRNIEGIGRS